MKIRKERIGHSGLDYQRTSFDPHNCLLAVIGRNGEEYIFTQNELELAKQELKATKGPKYRLTDSQIFEKALQNRS
jgi:hypothetical protein